MTFLKESAPAKVECDECQWQGTEDDLLVADHPFDPGQTVRGCPHCKAIDCFSGLCDEPGCSARATCGWPSNKGYRNTCGKHADNWRQMA